MTVETREFACWDGPEAAPLVRKWVPLDDYERLRAALTSILAECGMDLETSADRRVLDNIKKIAIGAQPQSEPIAPHNEKL